MQKLIPFFNEICFGVYQCRLCDIEGGVTVLPVSMVTNAIDEETAPPL